MILTEPKNRNVLHWYSLASLTVLCVAAASPVLAQQAASRCIDEGEGVINGTFDCAEDSLAWRFEAPASEGRNGYLAAVVSDPYRVSNVLELVRTELEPSSTTGGHPNWGLWQENIELPSARVSQFVLRFDYKLTSREPFDHAMAVVFYYEDICNPPLEDWATLHLTSMTHQDAENDVVSGGWLTAEIYLDAPSPCYSTDCLEFDVLFSLGIDKTCDSLLNYARVRLDNVEIRAVISGQEQALPLGDLSQPFYCEPAGGCDVPDEWFPLYTEVRTLQAVAGSELVDERSYGCWCVSEACCCGGNSCDEGWGSEANGLAWKEVEPSKSYSLFCIADLNDDGSVGAADLAYVLAAWGETRCGPPDFSGDGIVGAQDITHLLAVWGPCD